MFCLINVLSTILFSSLNVCCMPSFSILCAFFLPFVRNNYIIITWILINIYKYCTRSQTTTNSTWSVARKHHTDSLVFSICKRKVGAKRSLNQNNNNSTSQGTNTTRIVIMKTENRKRETRVFGAQTIAKKYKLWRETWNLVKKQARDVIAIVCMQCKIICNCLISRWPQVIYCNIFPFFPFKFWASNEKINSSVFFLSKIRNIEEKEWAMIKKWSNNRQ